MKYCAKYRKKNCKYYSLFTEMTRFTGLKEGFAYYSFGLLLLGRIQFCFLQVTLAGYCVYFIFRKLQKIWCFFIRNATLKFYAKYKFSTKMFRKLQGSILRKIQVSHKNVSQNTVINCCTQSSQNTDSSQNTISLSKVRYGLSYAMEKLLWIFLLRILPHQQIFDTS